ncbi:unnamed protein product [Enterobius vermicularis]|uniref:MIF4G domain-containing protein n=1 Tax=Enterobius vermicularis TaxID=51028 RepID=A0A0N4V852_ENTVE|nr:unnamed protein product [Enterobius vermicularis]
MANKRYGRRYMYLMREIIKEFALATSCPVDISQLKNLGIDIATAPANAPSTFGSGVISTEYQLLHFRHLLQKLYKQVRSLLNKITPSTFDPLAEEFLRYKCYQNKENMNEIINIIFDKAVEEPKFCPLYSDLCKKQVVDELQESKISEFRSGILTRCQQTFENKCQSEIDKKKKEELRVEVMELEAKERRRMFGNIGFIGQLYRHELIVPKILKCFIIALSNDISFVNGDEESIECAVRMLETVGKIVDYQQHSDFDINAYFQHLKDLSSSVSNRIRFLILNLIELRESKWNPRKSADSGPMTIAAVHDEARKEEMQAKLAREQYDKTRKPYDGRASLDRRRPALVGRQSQDNRFFNKGDQSRDQKTRAAGQAAHNAGTSSRKHQTLSTVGSSAIISF